MEEKRVISASRTRDLVRCAPGLLAQFLSGRRPVRFVRTPSLHTLRPGDIGALALWTKDPAPLSTHTALRNALSRYRIENGGAILLNLTVTGLGGTVLEPGIPTDDAVARSARALIESGLLEAEAVILRYDPLIEVRTGSGVAGNIDVALFRRTVRRFSDLGVRRIKVSCADYAYTHVARRLARYGIEPVIRSERELQSFIDEMLHVSRECGMRCDVCCNPASGVTDTTAGCIDGSLINALLERHGASWRVSERLHNDIGRQRPGCRCTWSTDIGYTPGIPSCFTTGGACLYCYSQRNMRYGMPGRMVEEEIPSGDAG